MTGLELYIHIPFCIRKCIYCDFLSFPADEAGKEAYIYSLLAQIRASGCKTPVTSVYLGGGTPSALPAGRIAEILEEIHQCFNIAGDAEITIEANPGTLSEEALYTYRAAGINRLSMGVQSSHNSELRLLGRIHSWEDFVRNYRLARKAGFSNINTDLIFALPGQSLDAWKETLRRTAGLEPEHISAYSLIVEEGTLLERHLAEYPPLPDEDTEYLMYDETAAVLAESGYIQYEISNYARKGKESRHNTGYWTGEEYLGLGLGASSFMNGERWKTTDSMEEYLRDSASPSRLRREIEKLTRRDAMAEYMFLGLRLLSGVSPAEFGKRFGVSMEQIYGDVIRRFTGLGLMEWKHGFLCLTRPGIHVSNRIFCEFLIV